MVGTMKPFDSNFPYRFNGLRPQFCLLLVIVRITMVPTRSFKTTRSFEALAHQSPTHREVFKLHETSPEASPRPSGARCKCNAPCVLEALLPHFV